MAPCPVNIRSASSLSSAPPSRLPYLFSHLNHGTLNLPGPPRAGVVPLASHGVYLVDEDDGGAEVVRDPEELPDELRSFAEVLLDKLGADYSEEGSGGVVGNGLGEKCLAGSRLAVKDDALGWLDADVLIQLGVGKGQLREGGREEKGCENMGRHYDALYYIVLYCTKLTSTASLISWI